MLRPRVAHHDEARLVARCHLARGGRSRLAPGVPRRHAGDAVLARAPAGQAQGLHCMIVAETLWKGGGGECARTSRMRAQGVGYRRRRVCVRWPTVVVLFVGRVEYI